MSTFINLLLVKEGIRPAFLLQPADYGEATGKDEITSSILREIRKVFPDLKFSEKYKRYQGILISKTDFVVILAASCMLVSPLHRHWAITAF